MKIRIPLCTLACASLIITIMTCAVTAAPSNDLQRQALELESKATDSSRAHDYVTESELLKKAISIRKTHFNESAYKQAHKQSNMTDLTVPGAMESEAYLGDLNRLGWAYQRQNNFKDAIPQFSEASSLIERLLGAHNSESMSAKQQLAICLWRADRFAEAEKVLLGLLQEQEKTVGADSEPLVQTLHSLSHVYQDWRRYNDAEIVAGRELKIARTKYSAKGAMMAGILENYASILRDCGKKQEALPIEKEAREIRALTHTAQEHPTQATVLRKP
jgi:tetratricopeptide (TPR) repeat protein